MEIKAFQELIRRVYLEKDRARGLDGTFMYFVEEVGELATALREEDRAAQAGEFADVFAWLLSLANLAGIDMEEALAKYKDGGDIHKSPKP
ncbi:MAG: nucleotide pyrophosphohydrolase [Planctomycetota bacterium]|nr:nucleotide pyrophosphohydrolase [Planctomycetota bacterium]